jgi:hypothetical protein
MSKSINIVNKINEVDRNYFRVSTPDHKKEQLHKLHDTLTSHGWTRSRKDAVVGDNSTYSHPNHPNHYLVLAKAHNGLSDAIWHGHNHCGTGIGHYSKDYRNDHTKIMTAVDDTIKRLDSGNHPKGNYYE